MGLRAFTAEERRQAGLYPPPLMKKVPSEKPARKLKQSRGHHKNYDAPIKKIYWSIGEVAEMFSVATSLIRFWLQEFGMDVKKNKKGNRQFTSADIGKLRRAYYLVKVRRFTLQGARQEMERSSVDVRGEQA